MSGYLKLILFAICSVGYTFMIYKPVIFPRCACCNKIKFRTYFGYFSHVGMALSHKGQLCVCKKCSRKYNIHSIYDFKRKNEMKKRIEYHNRYL